MRGLTALEAEVLHDASALGAPPYLARGEVQVAVWQLREAGRVILVDVPNMWGPTVRKVIPTAAGRLALMIHRFLQVGP